MTMRAAIVSAYGGPEQVTLAPRPRPRAGKGQVLIRVVTSTVNTADWRIRAAQMPPGFGPLARLFFGFGRPRQPVLGTECAGIVEATGDGISSFAPGDAVIAYTGASMGCHAEYVVAPVSKVIRKPAALGWDAAAALSFGGCTALGALRAAGVGAGSRVLVIGAPGSVGSAAIQIAAALGASVDATASPGNADLVRSLGADRLIDRSTDLAQGGADYDAILDIPGGASWRQLKQRLRPGGRLVMVTGSLWQLLAAPFVRGSRRPVALMSPERAEDMQMIADLVAQGKFRPLIDSAYAFDAVAEAHARVDSGRKRGAVVLRVGLEPERADG